MPTSADPLDAGIVDQDVDLSGIPVDPREGGRDAVGIGDVGLDIGDAGPRLVRAVLVEREHRRAVGDEPGGDGIADAARRTGYRRDLSGKTAHDRAPEPQYISQPPLTLIVAPVM